MLRRNVLAGCVVAAVILCATIWSVNHSVPNRESTGNATSVPAPSPMPKRSEAVTTTPGAAPMAEKNHSVEDEEKAPNIDSLVSGIPEADRVLAKRLLSRYAEAYQYSSMEQLEWMKNNGYPMPEDWVAAEKMTIEQLIALGKAGDAKAAMLAADRLLRQAVDNYEAGRGPALNDSPERAAMIDLEGRGSYQGNCSPFYLYIDARYYEELSSVSPGSFSDSAVRQALVRYAVLSALGDRRAMVYVSNLSRALGATSSGALDMAQSSADIRGRFPANCQWSTFPGSQ